MKCVRVWSAIENVVSIMIQIPGAEYDKTAAVICKA